MITCSRCGGERWPFGGAVEPYTCQRCREVLRGSKDVLDPLPKSAATPEEAEARRAKGRAGAVARTAHLQARGKLGTGLPGATPDGV